VYNIWHDNTGGKEAGWYLDKVVIIDRRKELWFVVDFSSILFFVATLYHQKIMNSVH